MGDVISLDARRRSSTPVRESAGELALQQELELDDPRVEQPRTCLLCKHAAIGDGFTYCRMFREEIIFESVEAQDCDEYEFSDDAALTWGD